MKTLDELYAEVNADDALKKEYIEAVENGKIEEFLKAHGCEATLSEFDEFMKNADVKSGELSDDELDNVAAGKKCGTVYKDGHPVVTVANCCEHFVCKKCGTHGREYAIGWKCANFKCSAGAYCNTCRECKYEGGLWICYSRHRVNN